MKYLPLLLLLTFAGCKKNDPDFDVLLGNIYKIEVQPTTTLGRSVQMTVFFGGGTDGCAKADHLEASVAGNITTFTAFYNYPKNPPGCTLNIPLHKLEYTFTPEAKGDYTFKSADGSVVAGIKVN